MERYYLDIFPLLMHNKNAKGLHQVGAAPLLFANGWARNDDNKDWILAFNDLIEQMHEDGTLAELSMKWFDMDVTSLPDGEVNTVTTTGDNAWQSYEN